MTDFNSNFQETFNKNIPLALKKPSILLWTNANPKLPNSFILKDKEGKRYLGLSRKDKKGETYWSFKEIKKKSSLSPNTSPVVDKVAQFEQRQMKTQNYANNSSKE